MPYSLKWQGNKFRLTDPATGRVAHNKRTGKPIDGGGHSSEGKAKRQIAAIMASEAGRGKR